MADDTRKDYFDSVRATAAEIQEAIADGEYTDRDDVEERIWEEADGSYWVIYHHANLSCLRFSDNWLAIDDVGDEISGDSLTDVLVRAAFYAYHADITEYVGDIDDLLEAAEDDE